MLVTVAKTNQRFRRTKPFILLLLYTIFVWVGIYSSGRLNKLVLIAKNGFFVVKKMNLLLKKSSVFSNYGKKISYLSHIYSFMSHKFQAVVSSSKVCGGGLNFGFHLYFIKIQVHTEFRFNIFVARI